MGTFPLVCAEKLLATGLLVKSRRLLRKIRQKDLAGMTGLSVATLGKIEAGTPTVEIRAYLLVLWHLGLLDEVFKETLGSTSITQNPTEKRVRLRKIAEDDF
ncbi:XRE family transcriptional regulator [Stutzerimonas kirkiae]|uniref:XRE family transcriptional regulator n=1 Tax=Stutzerimonas kirkiae TaxID=2211392 RepID=A0A4Q9RCB1_9GAMM|nr:XRE family transcriptional regulator [Stutzerimonas kirkiae]TBV04311.1 XRE family transcriptional regulator [Stutzerimonas kirkiae]TBV11011.1 XRE family transcriptional regulator [Stutzerimonas kirkiae]TBV14378.1 XRE family transcriptional regulator [Stutzerimonas kirkiae]